MKRCVAPSRMNDDTRRIDERTARDEHCLGPLRDGCRNLCSSFCHRARGRLPSLDFVPNDPNEARGTHVFPQRRQFGMMQDQVYRRRDRLGVGHLWGTKRGLENAFGGGVRNWTFIRPRGPIPVALTQPGASPRRTAPSVGGARCDRKYHPRIRSSTCAVLAQRVANMRLLAPRSLRLFRIPA